MLELQKKTVEVKEANAVFHGARNIISATKLELDIKQAKIKSKNLTDYLK